MEFLKRNHIKVKIRHCEDNGVSIHSVHMVDLKHYTEEPVKESVMVRSFIWYARLGRFFGCFFIANLSDTSLEKARATWKSFYTLYSAAWVSMLVFFEGSSMLEANDCRTNWNCRFTESLGVLSYCIAAIKVFMNFVCLAYGSTKLLAFFRQAAAFERSNRFVPTHRSMIRSRSWLTITLKLTLIASLVTTLCLGVAFHLRSFYSSRKDSNSLLRFMAMCSTFTFIFYESFLYLAVTSFSEVLAQYLKMLVACFETCQGGKGPLRMDVASIEEMRFNVCKIKRLKTAMNKVFGPAIATSSACLLVMLCTALYRSFHTAPDQVETCLAVAYTVYCTLCFVDMVFASDCLGDQAQKLKDATKEVSMVESTESLYRQIHYLHDVINPEEMYLSAARFCRLDRSLLVTMTGSVLTFTVILVQTSDDIKHEFGHEFGTDG